MNKHLKIFIFLILYSLTFSSLAQFDYAKNAQEAHNAILDLNFDKYDSIKKHHTADEDGVYYWLDGYRDFVVFNTSSKKNDVDSEIAQIQYFISSIEQLSNDSPFYYYGLADLHLFLSFLYFGQDERIRSVQHYLNAKSLINKIQDKYPEFEYLGKHLLVQLLINRILNQQLGFIASSNTNFQTEYINLLNVNLQSKTAVYKRELKLLGIMLYNFDYESNPAMLIKEVDIDIDYSKTGPLEALASSILYKKADFYSDQFLMLDNAIVKGFQKNVNTFNLWYGIALLNRENDSCIYYINKFLLNQQNPEYIQYAQFKASLYWFLKSDFTKSDSLNHLIEQSNLYSTSEDKQALYEISKAVFWREELVTARLLFDGGEYKKALTILLNNRENVANYSNEQKLEYSYRMGRIYDKFNDIEKAKRFYLMVINSKLDDQFYYPAYAAYYLGNMYIEKGDLRNAKHYYLICSELESPIYKSSIHKKARQAIN